MNRIKTMLALTGAIGLLAILPASQASANHAPGATYTGTHEQGGPVSFTLSGEGQGCVGAQRKVKKLKKKLKKADSAQQKKKLRKKLRKAKGEMAILCTPGPNTFPAGATPTGTVVKSFSIGGPIIVVEPGTGFTCTILGPTETFVTDFGGGEFSPEIVSLGGMHIVEIEGDAAGFAGVDGFGAFFGPQTVGGSFDLVSYRPIPSRPGSACRYIGLRWTATT